MSSKVIDVRAGDRWTRDSADIWQYRDGACRVIKPEQVYFWQNDPRLPSETDLPTPDAHAQLRAWGYEVRGEEEARFDAVDARLSALQKSVQAEATPLPESRVREIVREELAAQAKPAPAPEPDGQGVGEAVPKWAKLLIQAAVDARAYLAKSQSCREANALRLGLDIALSSARTNLAAKGGK